MQLSISIREGAMTVTIIYILTTDWVITHDYILYNSWTNTIYYMDTIKNTHTTGITRVPLMSMGTTGICLDATENTWVSLEMYA